MAGLYRQFHSVNFFYKYCDDMSTNHIELHSHDIWELIFLKKGDLSYMVEGKVYRVTKNCLILTRPSRHHSITINAPFEYERYNILFAENLLSAEVLQQIPANIDIISFEGNELVQGLFKKTVYYSENFEGEVLKDLLLHLTEEILCNVLIASRDMDPSMYTVNPIINQAVKYINENITSPLTIDAICDELYITKSHLHHLFVKHLMITPKKYITSKKLVMAQRELRSGGKPSDLYLAYGFSDYSTFYRDYKKHFGHSPSEEAGIQITPEITS